MYTTCAPENVPLEAGLHLQVLPALARTGGLVMATFWFECGLQKKLLPKRRQGLQMHNHALHYDTKIL